MKLTDSVKIYIQEKTARYCKQLQINRPDIVYTRKEVLELPRFKTDGRRSSAYKYFGVAYTKHNIVFINVKMHNSRPRLDNTIRHELVHMRFPYLTHGRTFNKHVKALEDPSKTYDPYNGKFFI